MHGNRIDRYAHRLRSKILKHLGKRFITRLGVPLHKSLRCAANKQQRNAPSGLWDEHWRKG